MDEDYMHTATDEDGQICVSGAVKRETRST